MAIPTPPDSKLGMAQINYEVTRLEFNPSPIEFDNFGIPIRKKFNCMISYQWGYQDLVREVYTSLSVRGLVTWFDIWLDGMQGYTNNAMATAVCKRLD